ncbi:MAG: urea ABC transporter ATP-binding subunit UrtE [Chloroflexales bacterium]
MLQIENLAVYYGESRILNSVSLEVPSGQVVCLMGRNGVGKTTLMKAIIGLLRARVGTIRLDGKDITQRPPHERARAGVGYVPQGRGIFPYLTVYENLLMGFEASSRRTADLVAIEEMYALFPVIKQMRGRVAGTLSGGQQQQLAIARVLVRRPALLLLDEPTEGVQPSITLEIEDVIRALRQRGDMAILLVEQFLDFALSVADSYAMMETGSIVARGPVSSFDEQAAHEYLAF